MTAHWSSELAGKDAQEPVTITTRRQGDLLAISLMLALAISAITLSLLPVVTNELRENLGLTEAQIGVLTSVFMGFYGVSGVTSGVGAARWGGRLLGISFGCFVVGSLIFGLSTGFGGLLVGRAIQGMGGGMVTATCNPVMAHALPRDRLGRAGGIFGSGWGLGIVIALLIFPRIQSAGGYRAVFLTNAGLALLVGVAAFSQKAVRALPQHPQGATTLRGLALSLGAVVTNRRVLLLSFTNTALLAITVGILSWTPSFLQDVHGSPEAMSVHLVAGLGAAQLVSNPLGAMAAGRWGKLAVIVASLVLMSAATGAVPIVPGVPLAFAMVLAAGFFSFFFFAALLVYLSEVVCKPEHVGPATGVNCIMGFVGSLIAPWIFGLFLDAGGRSSGSYPAGYLMLASFGVAATIGMSFFRRLERPPQ